MPSEFRKEAFSLEDKDPTVPEIAAVDITLSCCRVGFFDEGIDFKRIAVGLVGYLAFFDVAVARVRAGRFDSEEYEASCCRDVRRLADGFAECIGVLDQVIGRQHNKHRLGIARRCDKGRDRDSGCCIARGRFQYDVVKRGAGLRCLLAHEEPVGVIAYDNWRRKIFCCDTGECRA